ncbi:MAG: hypothetical protein B7Y99_05060 [Caulobacterales bacterium 32-69-10]|nr:MAG: hypothetical protein B7Y99_05060 [Caulobacterales bacterium 32-69-10]
MTIISDFRAVISGDSWNYQGVLGQAVFLTYSFETVANADLTPVAGYGAAATASFTPMSEAERATARAALAAWEADSGLKFFEVPSGQGDIRFSKLDFELIPEIAKDSSGFAYYPGSRLGGDVLLDSASDFSTHPGILLHEIGHALGFKHPFEGDLTTDTLTGQQNTVMAYGSEPSELKAYDLEAARHLYGGPGADGTQVSAWSWDPSSFTLVQTGLAGGDTLRGVETLDRLSGGAGNDNLFGSGGADQVNGDEDNDTLSGGDGDDSVFGGAGDDMLVGNDGADVLDGGDGADVLIDAGSGGDTLRGGAGADQLYVEAERFFVDGGSGSDVLGIVLDNRPGPSEFNLSRAFANGSVAVGIEAFALWSGDFGDTVTGSDLADQIAGEGGDDQLNGLAADDGIWGDDGADTLSGGSGADYLSGGAGDDIVLGGTGADSMTGGVGFDQVSYADETAGVSATLNSDRPVDGFALERMIGFEGAIGSPFGDSLTGDAGANLIRGLDGADLVDGGAGDDDVNGNVGADVVHGGAGSDFARGGKDNDAVYGDAGDDTHVNGNLGDDSVYGGEGNDTVYGGQGADHLLGEAGDDWLSGDLGNDLLTGGAGADRFLFRAGSGGDWVADFNAAEGDRIQLAPATAYTVADIAGQAALDLGGGDVIVLMGVAFTAFTPGWVVFV